MNTITPSTGHIFVPVPNHDLDFHGHISLFIRLLILVGLFPNFLFIIIQEIVRMDISNNVTKLVTSATCKPFFVILHCLTKGIPY